MPRPRCRRRIGHVPAVQYYKPAGVPLRDLAEVVLTLDEVEALRLADAEGMYQEQAAAAMQISRPTFSRLVAAARGKVARALAGGLAIRLEGGPVDSSGAMTPPIPRPCGRRGKRCRRPGR